MDEQAILGDVFFVTLYGGVTMLDAVAAIYLLRRRANAIAPEVTSPVRLRLWVAAFLLFCALSHAMWLLYVCHPSLTGYVTVCGLDILLFIPSIAGILLAMLQDRHRPVWPVVVSLAPAVVMAALCIIRNDDALFVPLSVYVVSLYALFMLYIFHAVRRYGRWLRDNYADLEHKDIWQSVTGDWWRSRSSMMQAGVVSFAAPSTAWLPTMMATGITATKCIICMIWSAFVKNVMNAFTALGPNSNLCSFSPCPEATLSPARKPTIFTP